MILPKNIKIVVVGGGTGTFTLLSALKNYTNNLTAIVNMVDDGGSTGVLRDELGVLPPGDVRQCLVALSDSPKMRELFNYRFEEGSLSGHAFGNIFLTGLEKVSGSFVEAINMASEVLRVNGKVVPATLDNVRLKMEWPESGITLIGQSKVAENQFENDPRKAKLSLIPRAKANPAALKAIKQADLVIIAPGDLYSSVGPLLIIDGIAEALSTTKAMRVYVSNLVTKHGQTDDFSVGNHADEIERFVGHHFLEYVIYNTQTPSEDVSHRYREEKAFLVKVDESYLKKAHYKLVSGKFLGKMAERSSSDKLLPSRSLIRHDSASVAHAILDIYAKQPKKLKI